jgi:hypothetical protein
MCIAIGILASGGTGSFSAALPAVFFLCGVSTPASFFIKAVLLRASLRLLASLARVTISKTDRLYKLFFPPLSPARTRGQAERAGRRAGVFPARALIPFLRMLYFPSRAAGRPPRHIRILLRTMRKCKEKLPQ